MSSSAGQYFQNSQYYNPQNYNPQNYNPQFYTPLVNVPTLNRLPSHGELTASVELLIAHVTKFSNRLDRIESRVNDWVNLGLAERMMIVERDVDVLKKFHNENNTKIAATNIELDYAFVSIKCANERMIDNEKVVDRISDILAEHESRLRHYKQRCRDNAKKCAEIGILRRRLSKVEDFNTEFAECFESPSQLRGVVTEVSNHVEECDRTLTYMVRYGCSNGCEGASLSRADDIPDYSNFCEDYKACDQDDGLEAWKNVEEYFANYGDEGDEGAGAAEVLNCEAREQATEQKEKVAPSSSFQRSPTMATCDGLYMGCETVGDDEDEDFEKL